MSARPGFRNDRSDARIEQLRVPPHSTEAEQAVLGGLMLAPESYDSVGDVLVENDFYRRDHQLIYRAIRELAEKSRPFDAVTLGEWFDSQGYAEQIGDGAYLVELATTTPSAANIRAYAEIVRDKAVLRQLIEVGTGIVNDGFQPEGRDSAALLAKAEQEVFAIAEAGSRGRQDFTPVKRALQEAFDVLQTRYNNGGGVTGMATGYTEFDEMTAGLQPGDLIIIAARPSMGKTSYVMNCAQNAALNFGVPVLVFSLEMSKESLIERVLCSEARVDSQRLRGGFLETRDWINVTKAASRISEASMWIDDSGSPTLMEIRAKCRRWRGDSSIFKNGLSQHALVVVDYLQLIQGRAAGRDASREREISEISRGLKALAKELNVPIIALSQLSRQVESRDDKRPQLSDLRESGSIEQDADIVMFIFREEYYVERKRPSAEGTPEYAEWQAETREALPPGRVRLHALLINDYGAHMDIRHDLSP